MTNSTNLREVLPRQADCAPKDKDNAKTSGSQSRAHITRSNSSGSLTRETARDGKPEQLELDHTVAEVAQRTRRDSTDSTDSTSSRGMLGKGREFVNAKDSDSILDYLTNLMVNGCKKCTQVYKRIINSENKPGEVYIREGRNTRLVVTTKINILGKEINLVETAAGKKIGEVLANIGGILFDKAGSLAPFPGIILKAVSVIIAFLIRASLFVAEKAIIAAILLAARVLVPLIGAVVAGVTVAGIGGGVGLGVVLPILIAILIGAFALTIPLKPTIVDYLNREIRKAAEGKKTVKQSELYRSPLEYVLDKLRGEPGKPSRIPSLGTIILAPIAAGEKVGKFLYNGSDKLFYQQGNGAQLGKLRTGVRNLDLGTAPAAGSSTDVLAGNRLGHPDDELDQRLAAATDPIPTRSNLALNGGGGGGGGAPSDRPVGRMTDNNPEGDHAEINTPDREEIGSGSGNFRKRRNTPATSFSPSRTETRTTSSSSSPSDMEAFLRSKKQKQESLIHDQAVNSANNATSRRTFSSSSSSSNPRTNSTTSSSSSNSTGS